MDSTEFFILERAVRDFHEAYTYMQKVRYKFDAEYEDFWRHQLNAKRTEVYTLAEKHYKGKDEWGGPTKLADNILRLFRELFEYERVNKLGQPFKGFPGYISRIEHRKTQIKELQEKVAKLIEEAE